MEEDYQEDFEQVEEEIEVSPDRPGNKKGNKDSYNSKNNYGDNNYSNGRNSENRNPVVKQSSISNTSKTRKTYALKPINNNTNSIRGNSRNESRSDLEDYSYGGRQREKTPPKKITTNQKRGEILEFDFTKKGTGAKSKAYSPPKDMNKVSLSGSYTSYYENYKHILENPQNFQTAKEIEKENEKIREYLKDLNNELSKVVEHTSIANLAPKKHVEFKYKSLDEKHRIISRELNNNEKIFETTYEEYQKLKSRIDSIKSPEYLFDLQERIEDAEKQIEKIKKQNMKLNLQSVTSAKDLHDIENETGMPANIREANEKQKELAIIKRKLDKLIEQNDKLDIERVKKTEDMEKAKERFDKLTAIAEALKISPGNHRRAEQFASLKRQVALLEESVKHTENKNQKYMDNYIIRELEDLMVTNERDREHIKKLDEMIEQQKQALREIIEKEGLRDKTDKLTKEVVKKIELSLENNNTYPTDISILDNNTGKSKNNKQAKPPLAKDAKKDIYDGLPLFSPSKIKKEEKKILIRKTDLFSERKSPRGSGDREGSVEARENKFASKPEKKTEKKEETSVEQASARKTPIEKKEEKSEEKPKEEVNPAFSKPNLFKKPFGRRADHSEESSMKFDESTNKPMTDLKLEPTNKTQTHNNSEGLQMPDYLANKPFESNKNEPLRLSEEFQPKKKTDSTINNSKPTNEPLKLNDDKKVGESKLLNEVPMDESIQLGGVSRLNKGRRNRGQEEDSYQLTMNQKPTDSIQSNQNKGKDIVDPFSKFDNIDNLNLGNKKITEPEKKPANNFENPGLFNPVEDPPANKNKPTTINQPTNNMNFGLFNPVEDDPKPQLRRGPRDRISNNNNTDDIFGGPKEDKAEKIDLSVKENNNVRIGNKPKKINAFDMGGSELPPQKKDEGFSISKPENEFMTKDPFGGNTRQDTKKNDDIFDYGSLGGGLGKKNNDYDMFEKKEEPKKEEKFSLAPKENDDAIGSKPRRMKMGNKENKEKDLALKAEKGGGGFFDEFEV